jgi:allantoin racemase
MRLLVLAPFVLDRRALANRAAQAEELGERAQIEFQFRGVQHGPADYDTYVDWLVADVAIVHAGLHAQEEGFDAICVDTLSDAGVAQLRSAVDLPVVGAGEAGFLIASLLASNFSILTQWRQWYDIYKSALSKYGMREKCVSMRSIEVRPDLHNLLGGKESVVFPRLLEEGLRCVDDGAECIVLGSTTMHQAHEYLQANLPVPVVNPGPASYKVAQALVDLGQRHSRATWRKADPVAVDALSRLFSR